MNDEHLTTNQGVPVTDNQSSLTVGERGPVLLQDVHLIEKLAHFDRERIAERVVHAKGAGAHGYFQVYKLSLIHISEPTRLGMISYAVFCLKKKKQSTENIPT